MPAATRFVTFRRSGVFYGIDVSLVRQAVRLPAVEPLPAAPDFVAGRSFVDGRYEVIVDPARVFSPAETGGGTHAVLVSRDGREFGFLADQLGEVIEAAPGTLRDLPPFVGGRRPEWLRGRVERDRREIFVLDLERILEAAAPDRTPTE